MTLGFGLLLAAVRTIQHLVPCFGPCLAPRHGFCAVRTCFLRQVAFFYHFGHLCICAANRICFKALLVFAAMVSLAHAQTIAPFKDAEFAAPAVLSGSWDEGLVTVDYNELRDINGRDQIPEKRAGNAYVNLSVRRAQEDLSIPTPVGDVKVVATGQSRGARFVVIYIHGQGGSRLQGADDFSFGGNFNRLKNLAARSGGLYLSPDFTDFGARGVAEIAALIGRARGGAVAGAPVIVACASQGGAICNGLALSPVGGTLGGLLFLGASPDGRLLQSDAWLNRVPVYIGHGSADSVFAIAKVEAFYKRLAANGYPAKMVRFETGSHGTPIRMTDWRLVLNWMMAG
jgi:hypothetical protein